VPECVRADLPGGDARRFSRPGHPVAHRVSLPPRPAGCPVLREGRTRNERAGRWREERPEGRNRRREARYPCGAQAILLQSAWHSPTVRKRRSSSISTDNS
jgi:hypothetical protein